MKKLGRKSMFYKWFRVCLAFVAFLLCISIFIILMSNKLMGNKTYEQGYSILSLLQKNIDEIFISAEKMVITLENEQNVRDYMTLKYSDDRKVYALEQLQVNKLKNEVFNNPYLSNIFIYSPVNGRCISVNGAVEIDECYQLYFKKYFQYEKFKNIMNDNSKESYVFFSRSEKGIEYLDYIVRTVSVSGTNNTEKSGKILIWIDANKIHNFISENSAADGVEVCISAPDNTNMIFTKNGVVLEKNIDGYDRLIETTEDSKNEDLYVRKSSVYDFKYVLEGNNKTLNLFVKLYISVFIVAMLIIFGICMTVLYKFIYFNYTSFCKVFDRFNIRNEDEFKNMNEIEFLDKAIGEMLEKHNDLLKIQGMTNNEHCAEIPVKVLKFSDNKKILERYKIVFENEFFCLVSIYVMDMGIFSEDTDNANSVNYEMVYYVLKNIYGELFADVGKVYFCEEENALIAVLNLQSNDENTIKKIEESISYGRSIIENEFAICFYTDKSSTVRSADLLYEIYRELVRRRKGLFDVHNEEFLEDSSDSSNRFYTELIMLNNKIKMADFLNIDEDVTELVNNFIINQNVEINRIRCMILNYTILEAFKSILDDKLYESVECELNLSKYPMTINKYTERFNKVIKNVKCASENDEKCEEKDLIKKINKFISENYSNQLLGLSMIGDYVNMTPVKIAKIYKEKNNITILQYINHIRMEKCKALLINTDMFIKEIAAEVGYEHELSFIRWFKNKEGITPKNFRELNRVE